MNNLEAWAFFKIIIPFKVKVRSGDELGVFFLKI